MDVIALFKAVMVGFFSFMIAVGAVLSVVSAITKQSITMPKHVRKLPAFLIFAVILLGGWIFIYLGFISLPADNSVTTQQMMMIYAYLFALIPSVALMLASFVYYLDVRSAAKKEGKS